jgi:hypothetical protein
MCVETKKQLELNNDIIPAAWQKSVESFPSREQIASSSESTGNNPLPSVLLEVSSSAEDNKNKTVWGYHLLL